MKRPDTTVYRGERLFARQCIIGVRVTVEGRPLPLLPSIKIRNHSPSGFEWGYGGSGPAQLALALVLDATGDEGLALRAYQWFKWAAVCCWGETWEITAGEIRRWLDQWEREGRGEDSESDIDEDADTPLEVKVEKGGAA